MESGAECIQQFKTILARLATTVAEPKTVDSFKEKSLLLDALRKENTAHLFHELDSLL